MTSIAKPRSVAGVSVRPTAAMLMAFPAAFFVGAFVTDIVYWRTAAGMWEDFSIRLLVAGLVTSALAVLAVGIGLIDRRPGDAGIGWPGALGNTLAIVLSIFSACSRDGVTAVVPTGITLSGLVVLILLIARDPGDTMWRATSAAPGPVPDGVPALDGQGSVTNGWRSS